jgi:hypothetical protein
VGAVDDDERPEDQVPDGPDDPAADDPAADDPAVDDADGEPFERPIDRFRRGAVGSVVAAGLLGLGEALEGRAPKEEVTIVQEAPSQPHRGIDLVLDPDHPERSVVYLAPREPDPAPEPGTD